jgi:hypothetical protein
MLKMFINELLEWSQTEGTCSNSWKQDEAAAGLGLSACGVSRNFVSIGSFNFNIPGNPKNVFINGMAAISDHWSQALDIVTITLINREQKI